MVPAALLRLADAQAGVVSRGQALDAGVSRHVITRLVESEAWLRLGRGVFLTRPTTPDWDALAWGGVLLGGPLARLGPESSAFLHRLSEKPPDMVDVLVDAEREVAVAGPWRFIRERPGARSGRSVGAPPRLSVESTVIDLSNIREQGAVVGLVTTAVQRRLTTVERLRREAAGRSRLRHRRLLDEVLADVDEGAQSPIERGYLRDVERPHRLPQGRRQQSRSGLRYQTDVDYDRYPLVVELDGRAGHEATGVFRDMERDNRHALSGAMTLRYGWFDLVHRPCAVGFQVWTALRVLGWADDFTRCRRCSRVPLGDLARA